MGLILGVETSCDETAAALIEPDGTVRSSVVRSQVDLHARYGGVVPEIAGRSHVEVMQDVLAVCFEQANATPADLGAVAVTQRPGLIGSLLVGLNAAKAIAMARRVPLIAVDHVQAHVLSCFHGLDTFETPSACLVASGGHSTLYRVDGPTTMEKVGETLDDAAGEAFDKVAALLGLPYPGGPAIERTAEGGDGARFKFPRPMMGKESLDFSFSGVKTAVLYHCRGPKGRDERPIDDDERRDIAASFQTAVVDVLVRKLLRLADRIGARSIGIGGGVAANTALRTTAAQRAEKAGLALHLAPKALTGDNAVMIADLGRHLWRQGVTAKLDIDARPQGGGSLSVEARG